MLVEDDGRTSLRPGDCAAWPKGARTAITSSTKAMRDCVFVVVGGGKNTGGGYSDIDMVDRGRPLRPQDGTPYEPIGVNGQPASYSSMTQGSS